MDKPLWGLKVLKFDGAIAPRVLRFDAPPARGLWWAPYIYRRRPLMIKPNNRAFARGKTIQPPCGRRKCIPPLVAGATTLPVGSMSLDSRVAYSSPMNPVPLPPPQFGGAAKGKRLNGQARRLTSPHLEVLCRTSTGDYKAPLCCELLMKGLLFRALLSHRSAGGRWCRKAPKGEKPPEVADYRSA